MSAPSSGLQSPAIQSLPYIVGWDVDEVGNWLERIGLWQYRDSFVENDITGEVLIHLDHEFLKELGITSVGHRLHILKSVYDIKIAQDVPIEPGQFVPLSMIEQEAADHEPVDVQRLMKSLEIRDRRIMHAELEIRRLTENYSRLREDLLPIFKMVKESKPLPTPEYAQYSGPAFQSNLAGTSSRHSMFISSSQPLSGLPQSHSSFNTGPYSSELSRKASNMKMQASNPSPTRTPEWLENTLTPATALGSASSIPASATNSNTVAPPSAGTASAQSSHYRNAIGNGPVLSPPIASQPNSIPISSSAFPSSLTLSEAFKPFKLKQDDPCYKVLPAVLKGHKINDDWRQYALLVCFGDQERLLGLDEKPLSVMKELQDAGKQPVFMLRPIQGMKHEQGAIVSGTPGGVL